MTANCLPPCWAVTSIPISFVNLRPMSVCCRVKWSGASMKKQQVDHILRAAGEITGEKQFIIIGSQSLHGTHPNLPDEILRSFEVDLIAKKKPDKTEWLNMIGQDWRFHETHGTKAQLLLLLDATSLDEAARRRIRDHIERDFR